MQRPCHGILSELFGWVLDMCMGIVHRSCSSGCKQQTAQHNGEVIVWHARQADTTLNGWNSSIHSGHTAQRLRHQDSDVNVGTALSMVQQGFLTKRHGNTDKPGMHAT